MAEDMVRASPEAVRRLAVAKQKLAGPLPRGAAKDDIVRLVRDLCYVQWDPVPIVAPSHLLSIWARLGKFRPSDLEALMWDDRKIIEHWTPIASLVLTEDFPLYYSLMKRYPESLSRSWGNHIPKAKKFLADHAALRRKILRQLEGGPLRLSEFSDHKQGAESPDGWTPGSDVTNMLYHLSMLGEVMVVGHRGNQNLWGLTEGFLPRWVKRGALTPDEFEKAAAKRAIGALGTAAPHEIVYYFVRGRYGDVKKAISGLKDESLISRVAVEEFGSRDERYILSDDLPLLESVLGDDWEPRMSLVPPFDNMLAGNRRLDALFGFEYVREQFLPKEKRRYGTYVLPIVFGGSFIGRIDPRLDKERDTLVVNAVHAEPGAPKGRAVAAKLAETIEGLAEFIGARGVEYGGKVPEIWKGALR